MPNRIRTWCPVCLSPACDCMTRRAGARSGDDIMRDEAAALARRKAEAHASPALARRREPDPPTEPRDCGRCGTTFAPRHFNSLYCSEDCTQAVADELKRKYNARRSARTAAEREAMRS